MQLWFEIENITPKEADDVADAIIAFLIEDQEVMVTDYEVTP